MSTDSKEQNKCSDCGREFDTAEALMVHRRYYCSMRGGKNGSK